MQSGTRVFNAPAVFARAAAMVGTMPSDHRLDATIAQRSSMSRGIDSVSKMVPRNRRIHGIASICGGNYLTPLTFAPAKIAASGVPLAPVGMRRWALVRERSVESGPVFRPTPMVRDR